MNLVGKIFVVLTLVLSLVLMSLTVVVYMTQVNWMRMANNTDTKNGYPLGLIQQLENCQKENQELRNAYAILVGTYEVALQKSTNAAKEVDVVKNSQVEEISKLNETIANAYQETNGRLEGTLTALVKMNTIHSTLRDSVHDLQKEISSISDKLSTSTDYENQTAQLKLQLKEMKEQKEDLLQENIRAKEVLTYNNMINDLDYYRNQAPPAMIQGRVIEAAGRKIKVNIGSDDGVRVGHKFQLLSQDGSRYLCDVDVENVTTDTATCTFANLRSEQSINVVNGCIVKPL